MLGWRVGSAKATPISRSCFDAAAAEDAIVHFDGEKEVAGVGVVPGRVL